MIETWLIDIGVQQWQSAMTGLLALASAGLLRRRWPRAAHAVVLLALTKFLVPAVFDLPFAVVDQAAIAINPFEPIGPSDAMPAWTDPATWAAAIWLLGAIALLSSSTIRRGALRRCIQAAQPATEAAMIGCASQVAHRLGLRRVPQVLVAPVDGPLAIGIVRPRVILPASCAHLPSDHLASVLSHEFLHHRRHDLAGAWLSSVVVTACWFNPVAWALAWQLRALREDCCDDEVIESGVVSAGSYADALLTVAGASVVAGTAAMRATHPLGRRLTRLLTRPDQGPRQSVVVAIVVVLFVVLCLPTSAKPSVPDDRVVIRTVLVR